MTERLVAIIDYGSGNLRSAEKALARAAAEARGGQRIAVTADAQLVARAERIVLPGVGAFGDCMEGLNALAGMRDALDDAVRIRGVPFLGICVGMQLLASTGHEFGEHAGLDWIAGDVMRLEPSDSSLRIPHMGWNELRAPRDHPVLDAMRGDAHAYFVHSYEVRVRDGVHLLATIDYGGAVTAAIGRDNILGVQFHPEKSQAAGIALLRNFLAWQP